MDQATYENLLSQNLFKNDKVQSDCFSNRGRLLGIERYSIIFQSDLNNNQISITVFNAVLVTVSVLESRCTYFCIPCLESSEQKPFLNENKFFR